MAPSDPYFLTEITEVTLCSPQNKGTFKVQRWVQQYRLTFCGRWWPDQPSRTPERQLENSHFAGFRWFRWLMALSGLLVHCFVHADPSSWSGCQGLAKYKSCIISHKKWDFPSSQFFLHPLFLIKGDEGLWEQDTALHPSGMCPAQRKMPKH